MMKGALILLLLAAIGFPLISNAVNTIKTVKSLKFDVNKVKWQGFFGTIFDIQNAGFTIDVTFKIDNPTMSDLTVDFINLTCSIKDKPFAVVNITDPTLIKANTVTYKPIRIKSATSKQLEDLIKSLISSGTIPSTIHMKGKASANTWSTLIDDDYNLLS